MTARMMEHEEAIKSLAAERYLLGELAESEREAYEEHLFSCAACFEQVKAGTEFVGQLRRIGAEEPRHVPVWRKMARGIFQPAASLAFAALFLCTSSISVYQAFLLHRPRDPEVVTTQVRLKAESRGEIQSVTSSRNGHIEVQLLVPYAPEFPVWKTTAQDASGNEVMSSFSPAKENGELHIVYDARAFKSGRYFLVVQGTNRTTGSNELLGRFPFELELKD